MRGSAVGEACSCHKQHLACTSYCNYSGGYDYCNPHSVGQGTQTEEAGENIDAEGELWVRYRGNLTVFNIV